MKAHNTDCRFVRFFHPVFAARLFLKTFQEKE